MYLKVFAPRASNKQRPIFPIPVPAGPAQYIEQPIETLSLDSYLCADSEDMAFLRVYGDSMEEANIRDGDLLIVRRTDAARAGEVVIAEINGEFTVKRLRQHTHGLYLVPANDQYPIRKINAADSFMVWGVVVHVIHSFVRFA